jgi:methyl-accepting chemotaxis protein
MGIGRRLALGFFVLVVLVAGIAGLGLYELERVDASVEFVVERNLPLERQALAWMGSATSHVALVYAFAIADAPDDLKIIYKLMSNESKDVGNTIATIEKSVSSERGRKLFKDALDKRAEYIALTTEIFKMNGMTPAGEIVGRAVPYQTLKPFVDNKWHPVAQQYTELVDAFRAHQAERTQFRVDEVRSAYYTGRLMLVVLAACTVVVAVVIGWLLTTGITRPLGDALHVAETISSGDLTARVEVRSKDEVGRLMGAMKEMNEYLLGAVSNVRASADTIATASSQIAAGTMDLSSRTEEQASSLQETASSMEELTSTVRQNGDNAKQANQLASQAADIAIQGGEAARKVADTMAEIDASANKIVDIISVIDGIAFQTNILALNAAVEAARAGEQGRGFAVVATEVRSLAQRSATAAKEIKDLIGDSVNRIRAGSDLVQQSTTTMLEVGESIRKVNDIMSEISAATQEQVSGIEQVNEAVSQMDTVSQQNAALVEQSAAASESMQDQARALVQVVGMFRIDQAGAAPEAPGAGVRRVSAPASPAAKRLAPPAKVSAPQALSVRKPSAQKPSALPEGGASDAGHDVDWEEF